MTHPLDPEAAELLTYVLINPEGVNMTPSPHPTATPEGLTEAHRAAHRHPDPEPLAPKG